MTKNKDGMRVKELIKSGNQEEKNKEGVLYITREQEWKNVAQDILEKS